MAGRCLAASHDCPHTSSLAQMWPHTRTERESRLPTLIDAFPTKSPWRRLKCCSTN